MHAHVQTCATKRAYPPSERTKNLALLISIYVHEPTATHTPIHKQSKYCADKFSPPYSRTAPWITPSYHQVHVHTNIHKACKTIQNKNGQSINSSIHIAIYIYMCVYKHMNPSPPFLFSFESILIYAKSIIRQRIYINIYQHRYIHMCMHVCVGRGGGMCARACVCVYVYMCVCVHVYTYVIEIHTLSHFLCNTQTHVGYLDI